MLSEIKSPEDIKNLSQKELSQLAKEIRSEIINVVSKNGGHLASNLGVVEITLALHRVFNSPEDAIVWDVSHQCYAHKLLTGRYNQFATLRQKDGLSGFTNTSESEHDFFINGHSSTSISSALGLLTAKNLRNEKGYVIAVIGDGALTGGLALEGLSHAGQLGKNLIVILNDNQMSIDHNTGSISRYLSRLSMSKTYQSVRYTIDKAVDHIPYLGRHLEKVIYRFKRSLKGLLLTNNLFTDLGFEYVGPLNGHNELSLEKVLKKVKKIHRPVVIHVVTKKGKGYEPAETNPEIFHGIGPFNIEDGSVTKSGETEISFTEAFSKIMIEAAEKNEKIVGITAAMAKGTGLSAFAQKYPKRFFDVGIAEEHAVTFAGGLSKGGIIPVVCIYSTFIQRAIDQMFHDITLQKAHCIFMLDRAGAVPGDGMTHQGIFDIPLFRSIPDLSILSPATEKDLQLCFEYGLKNQNSTVIRYPKLNCPKENSSFESTFEIGKGVLVKNAASDKASTLVVCTGGIYTEAMKAVEELNQENIFADLYSLRFIKPLDEDYFIEVVKKYKKVVFLEDGVITGGICEYLKGLMAENNLLNANILGFSETYYTQGTRTEVLEAAGLSVDHIKAAIK